MPPRIKTILLALSVALALPAAAETVVRLPRQDCAELVAHRPAPDVAYRPGVDAHGGSVAPADLPGSRIAVDVAKSVEFDLSFNPLAGNPLLKKGRTSGSASRFARSELVLGRISFDRATGKARFNGRVLSAAEQTEIAGKCRRALDDRREASDRMPR